MSIVVPVDSSEPWQLVIESALELTTMVSTDLEIVLSGSGDGFHEEVKDYVTSAIADRISRVHYTNTVDARTNLATLNRRMAVLAVLAPGAESAAYRSFTDDPLGWRGQVLLVPLDPDVLHRAYTDRMIIVVPEDADLDAIEPWATWIARKARSQISLLTVLGADDEFDLESRFRAAGERLRERAENFRRCGLRAAWEVRIGDPSTEIVRMAETTGTHLVVLPKPVRNFADEALLDRLIEHGRLHLLLTT